MRAALTGLRKRGYAVGIDRADKVRGSVYRIEPTEMEEDSAAPEMFGRTLIYLGLAEGIAIYGLVVTILLLGRIA